jgi:hypothetical protein
VLLSKTRVSVLLVVMVVVLVLSVELWGAVGSASPKDKDTHSATEDVQALTPIVGEVSKAPIPFEDQTEEHT